MTLHAKMFVFKYSKCHEILDVLFHIFFLPNFCIYAVFLKIHTKMENNVDPY